MPSRPVESPRWPVSVSGLLLAALCALTLWGRVYLDFDGVRQKLLQTSIPANQGVVRVTLPESPRFERLAPPAVFIAKLRNPGPRTETIAISFASTRLATITLPSGADRRIDVVGPNDRRVNGGDVLTFTDAAARAGTSASAASASAGSTWSVDYLEVANHHGSSRAVVSFFIVPRETMSYGAPGWLLIVPVTIAVAFLVPYGAGWPQSRRVRVLQLVLTVIVVLVFGAVIAASLLTNFKLLLAPKSFIVCVIALTWPGLSRAYVAVRELLGRRSAMSRALFEATIAAAAVALFYGLFMQALLVTYDHNYSGFLQIGSKFADRVPFLNDRPDLKRQLRMGTGAGYDGQFVYSMAFDPFLLAFKDNPVRYRDVVDAPPYRYGRIGFSLLTRLFSGDRPEGYSETMVWTIIGASFVGSLLLAMMAQQCGYSPAWGMLYVLVPGFVQSLHVALPEAIAAVGLIGGYWFITRQQFWWAAVLLGGSLLVRETGIIFVLALVLWQAWRARNHRAAMVLATSTLPVIAWRLYVGWRLFPDFKWEAFFFNPKNTGVPLAGILDMWRLIWRGQYQSGSVDLALAGIFYPLLLIAGLAVGAYLFWKCRDGLTGAIVVYALLAVSLNYEAIWTHVGNGERGTYELFMLMIVAFVTIDRRERFMRRLVGGFLVCTFLYLWLASVDAGMIRYAVLS